MSTAVQTLGELDGVLGQTKWLGPPSDMTHLHEQQHLDEFKHLGNSETIISQKIIEKAKLIIEASGSSQEFRICSVGCEDGSLDRILLSELSKAFPSIKLHYTGVEVDEQVCDAAEDKLTGVATNVEIEMVAKDYEELSKDDVAPVDLVLMVNCTYYASSLEQLLKGAVQLLKPTGKLLIISTSRQSFEELITRFWSHQRKHDLHTSEHVTEELTKLGITHSVDKATVTFDLSKCFEEDFSSTSSLLILDHLVFTRYVPHLVNAKCIHLCPSTTFRW